MSLFWGAVTWSVAALAAAAAGLVAGRRLARRWRGGAQGWGG